VTPGPLAPARELLGEMLLAANDPASAQTQFEAALEKEPARFRALYGAGRAAKLAGHLDASRSHFRELLRVCTNSDKPGRAELREVRKEVSQN
jgi:Tfp pilus assembly protein PilF